MPICGATPQKSRRTYMGAQKHHNRRFCRLLRPILFAVVFSKITELQKGVVFFFFCKLQILLKSTSRTRLWSFALKKFRRLLFTTSLNANMNAVITDSVAEWSKASDSSSDGANRVPPLSICFTTASCV